MYGFIDSFVLFLAKAGRNTKQYEVETTKRTFKTVSFNEEKIREIILIEKLEK